MDVARDSYECQFSDTGEPSLLVLVERFLQEPIDFSQNFELELTQTGPKEIVDVASRLAKWTGRDYGNDIPPQSRGECIKLTLTVSLQFRNIAHLFQQEQPIQWYYKLEASLHMMCSGQIYHPPFPEMNTRKRVADTLDFGALNFTFPVTDNPRIGHVCFKVTKVKMDCTDESNPRAVLDNFGEDFGQLYSHILDRNGRGDVELRMKGNNRLWAHKAVLSAKSSIFERHFRNNPDVHEINLEDDEVLKKADPGVVAIMWEFFYTNELDCAKLGHCPKELCDLLVKLYDFAHSNGLENLETACLEHVKFAVIDCAQTAMKYLRFAGVNGLSHMHATLKKHYQDSFGSQLCARRHREPGDFRVFEEEIPNPGSNLERS